MSTLQVHSKRDIRKGS